MWHFTKDEKELIHLESGRNIWINEYKGFHKISTIANGTEKPLIKTLKTFQTEGEAKEYLRKLGTRLNQAG